MCAALHLANRKNMITAHTRFRYDPHAVYVATPSDDLTIKLSDIWSTLEKIPFSGMLSLPIQCFNAFHECISPLQLEEEAERYDFAFLKHEFWVNVNGYLIEGSMLTRYYSCACGEPEEPFHIIEITDVIPLN